jgi:hypothetical protein
MKHTHHRVLFLFAPVLYRFFKVEIPMTQPTVYIGIGLTYATQQSCEQWGCTLSPVITHKGFTVSPFLGLTQGTSEEMHAIDTERVFNANWILAICDTPSTSLGMELALRIEERKPLIVHGNEK